MISKKIMCIFFKDFQVFYLIRKYILKRRQDMMDNDGFVDIQIILTDDFHTQQIACLTDLICEKYIDIYNKIFHIHSSFLCSPVELFQNKRCLRYVQAQHSEIFHVFARRLAYALVWIIFLH